MAVTAAVVGAGAAAVGTVSSIQAQSKASRLQSKQQKLSTQASRRQAIRQAQLARAQAVSQASATGATGSSAALGGQSSVGAQTGSEFGFSTQMSGLSQDISRQIGKANTASAVSSLGLTAFNYGASRGGLDFMNPKPTSPAAASGRPSGNNISAYRPPSS